MNSLLQQDDELLRFTQELWSELLSVRVDEDLPCKLPGRNLTLGALCKELGEF